MTQQGPEPRIEESAPPTSKLRTGALWLGLVIAFSPVLADLARHVAATPWTWYVAIFPLLFASRVARTQSVGSRQRSGWLWIAGGIAITLAGAFLGTIRIGRAGFLLAAVGLSQRFALASARDLTLLALCIPIPAALMKWVAPALPELMLRIGGLFHGPTADLPVHVNVARIAPPGFAIDRFDSGLALVPLLAGLAWYASAELREPIATALKRAGAWSGLALPAQAVATIVALSFSASHPSLARHLLTHTAWIAITVLALAWTAWRKRRI